MFNSNLPSISDIAAVTGRNNDGFAGGNGWWILIILFAMFGGWGRGYGYNDGGSSAGSPNGVATGYALATDVATLERKMDGINGGLCDGFYAMNSGMLNGFHSTDMAIQNGFSNVNNAVCTLGYQNAQLINGVTTNMMQTANVLQTQINDCCCQNREAIAQVRYDMATDACAINNSINQMGQNIMQNCNNNYRSLHDELIQFKMEAKDDVIARQAAEIQALNLRASQEAQNAFLVNTLRPQPNPAYIVDNPYCNCKCNTGCGNMC